MRRKVILFVIGLWLLACIVAGMHVLSQFMSAGNGNTMHVKIAISAVTMLWIGMLTYIFLRTLNDQFPVKFFKIVSAGWFVLVLVLHYFYTEHTLGNQEQIIALMPNVCSAHLMSFVVGLSGAIPFVLLTLVSKEGR